MSATFLTIAGSDPSGGAGIQADLKVAHSLGLYAFSVVTAITAQNTREISGIWEVGPSQIRGQIRSVLSDFKPDAVKIGMLMSPEAVGVIADELIKFDCKNLVVDPVLTPTLGKSQANRNLILALAERLFPLATLITPNFVELEEIEKTVGDRMERLCNAWLIKGGHRISSDCIDTLCIRGEDEKDFVHPRVNTTNTHGSGCVLSSAIACYLAIGESLPSAVEKSIEFVSNAMLTSSSVKLGMGDYGPVLI